MAYPNTSVLNIIIPQTSASIQDGQAPFVERIISGSRLVLQTTIDGTLTGSSDLNVNSITASNISASGYISASNLYVTTNITDAGTLTVVGNSILTTVTASNISASGNISSSNEYIAGTLTVIGNSTLSNVFATNITASNISASRIVASEITASSELFIGTGPAYRTYGEASVPENLARLYVSGSATIFSKYATLNLATSASDAGAQSSILFSRLASSGSEAVLSPRMQLGTESGSTDLRIYGYYSATDPDIINQAAGANIVAGTRAIFKQSGYFGVGNFISYGAAGGATTTYVSSLPGYAGIVGPDAMLTILPMDSASFGSAGSKQYNRNILNIMSYDTSSIMFISGSDGYVLLGKNTTDGINRLQVAGNVSASAYTGSSAIITNLIATNITSSNISASGFISGSDGIFAGDVAVNGGDITTTFTSASVFNTNATSVSIGGGATGQVLLGNSAGTVKSAGDFIAGTNIIKDGSGGVAVTVTSTLTTVAGDLQVNGNDIKDSNGTNNLTLSNTTVNVPLTTQATDWNNGALTVAGGVGIGKNLYASGSTFLYGDLTIFGVGSAGNTVNIGLNSTDTASLKVANNAFRVINGTGAGFDKVFTTLPISASNKVLFSNTTQATDWTTGALNVVGGVGIGKDLHVSGSTFVYGDFTVFGSSSVVYISSSTVIINDNIIQLNAFFPFERYAGIEVFDSGSNQRSASLLWDGHNDNWITVDQNNNASNIIHGPTASFGTNPDSLTANNIPKAYDATGITTSLLSDDATTLRYTGNVISASSITASYGTFTYITGALVTYVTGSFTTLTIATGSSPGPGNVAVPQHPTASGMAGQINVDNNFVYVYTNKIWKRVPLSTWSL